MKKSAVLNVCFLGGAAVAFAGLWWASPSVALVLTGTAAMALGIAGHVKEQKR